MLNVIFGTERLWIEIHLRPRLVKDSLVPAEIVTQSHWRRSENMDFITNFHRRNLGREHNEYFQSIEQANTSYKTNS